MKQIRRRLAAVLFVLASGTSLLAQSAGDRGAAKVAAPSAVADAKIEKTYNRQKNETTVEFKMLTMANTGAQKILLSASVSYPGRELAEQPADVIFIVSIVSPGGYKYPDVMNLLVKADGKPLPAVKILNLDKRELNETEFLETLGTRMRFDVFKRIAAAGAVEMEVENTRFRLAAADVEAFAALIDAVRVD